VANNENNLQETYTDKVETNPILMGLRSEQPKHEARKDCQRYYRPG